MATGALELGIAPVVVVVELIVGCWVLIAVSKIAAAVEVGKAISCLLMLFSLRQR